MTTNKANNKNNILPWLLGLLGLAAIGWLTVSSYSKTGNPTKTVFYPANNTPTDTTIQQVKQATIDSSKLYNKKWDGATANYTQNYNYLQKSLAFIDTSASTTYDSLAHVKQMPYQYAAFRALNNAAAQIAKAHKLPKADSIQAKTQRAISKINPYPTTIGKTEAQNFNQAINNTTAALQLFLTEKTDSLHTQLNQLAATTKELQLNQAKAEQQKKLYTYTSKSAAYLQQIQKRLQPVATDTTTTKATNTNQPTNTSNTK